MPPIRSATWLSFVGGRQQSRQELMMQQVPVGADDGDMLIHSGGQDVAVGATPEPPLDAVDVGRTSSEFDDDPLK